MYKYLGFIFVGLAFIGALLPVLPTTPFLLLAAGCFSKSSKRWHAWLLNNRTFGKLIRDWNENRCITFRSKALAFSMMLLFGGYSVFFALTNVYLQIFTVALIAYAIFFVSRIKTC